MRGDLHDAPGQARPRGHLGRQGRVGLEAQHGVRGAGQQLRGAVQRDDAPGLQHADPLAQRLGFFEVMRGQQHRVALLVQAGDELPQGLAQLHVDAGGGLVQHDDGWAVHQGLGHQHAALHAARELAHIGIGLVGQAQVGEQLVDPVVVVLDPEVAALDTQRLAHAEEGVEHQFLRHHAQRLARGGVVVHHVVAHHAHAALGGTGQAGQHADQRRLAGAVGAEQAEELAAADVEADAIQCLDLPSPVGFLDVLKRDGNGGGG
mmetsp:Transcript_29280/g.53020  ORF Transcript_29280/g.53020 Transcript_29280/m.53020 type:complete len:262 (-) Transcript_29280:10-795(-)